MNEKVKFYRNAERVLSFIWINRFRYTHIDEIKKEFEFVLADEELVNIINHLCNKDYIYITDPQNNTSFKRIKNLSCNVILKITLKGIKFLSRQKWN